MWDKIKSVLLSIWYAVLIGVSLLFIGAMIYKNFTVAGFFYGLLKLILGLAGMLAFVWIAITASDWDMKRKKEKEKTRENERELRRLRKEIEKLKQHKEEL